MVKGYEMDKIYVLIGVGIAQSIEATGLQSPPSIQGTYMN